ncbi:MAG: hypothetical protein JSS99_10590 [Actinobacteria bacterium]|nr:hypothetical protein [Actinomycetota bacterium]
MRRLPDISRRLLAGTLAATLALGSAAFLLGRALGGADPPQLAAPRLTPVAPAKGDALVMPAPIAIPRAAGR